VKRSRQRSQSQNEIRDKVLVPKEKFPGESEQTLREPTINALNEYCGQQAGCPDDHSH
jgi:hypothetical protein